MGLIETKVNLGNAVEGATKVEFPSTPRGIAISLLPATDADKAEAIRGFQQLKADGRPFQF